MSEHWQEFASFSDPASAEVAAELLRSEGVPVDIESDEALPGLIGGFRLKIPTDMLHRARWVMSNASFTDEELTFIATGSLDADAPPGG